LLKRILKELRFHAPFTLFGAFTGIIVMCAFFKLPSGNAYNIFYILHPLHVLLSALVTASMYECYKCGRFGIKCNIWVLLVVGYIGSIGIATLSDSLIPYMVECI